VANLTGIFKAEPETAAQDNDKLVDLFRNRAELKKEFAELRNEKYRLQDRIKEHRGAIERVQQKLNHLESLLLDPEWVHNVAVFYQFRRLAAHCERRISRFAEQLKQQREGRIRDKALAAWNQQRDADAAEIQASIGEQRMSLQLLEDKLVAERHRQSTMGGLSKMLNGKSSESAVEEIEAEIETAHAREKELLDELERIESLELPYNEGLDVATKRSINFMILSYTQQLYLLYAEDGLAALAKEASDKSVGAVNYGSKPDCDELLERLTKRREEVEESGDYADVLQQRAKLIAQHATFRSDDESVPTPGTVATVYELKPNGVVAKTDVNLLGENYFGVSKVLSR
jgi:hypothetical protein